MRIDDQNFWTNFPRIFREEVKDEEEKMLIKANNIRVQKVLSGFFMPRDFRYNALKGDFFNSATEILEIRNPDLLNIANLDIMKDPSHPELELRTTMENFNYGNIDTGEDDFIEKSIQLAEEWNRIFERNFIKVGGVLYFVLEGVDETPMIFFRTRYLKPFPTGEQLKQVRMHLNYDENLSGISHNVNLTLSGIEEEERIGGILDINQSSDEGLSIEEASSILKQVFNYCQNNLLQILNWEGNQNASD